MNKLTSIKTLDQFLAEIGLKKYGAKKLMSEIKAIKTKKYANRMQKVRLLKRIKALENGM